MKKIILSTLFLIAMLGLTIGLIAQPVSPVAPLAAAEDAGGIAKLFGSSFKGWFTDASLITVWLGILGRGWQAIRTGGGLVGIWRGLLYGTNVDPKIKQIADAVENGQSVTITRDNP